MQRPATHRVGEFGRKAWRYRFLELRPARSDQHDAAVTSTDRSFDKAAKSLQGIRHRATACDHLEQPLFTGEQCFSPVLVLTQRFLDLLSFVNVGAQSAPFDD